MDCFRGIKASVVSVSILLSSQGVFAGEVLQLRAGNFVIPAQKATNGASLSATSQRFKEFVVQYKNEISEESKEILSRLGVSPLRYLPEDAYVVRTTEATMENLLQADPSVSGYQEFQSEWRIDPDLMHSTLMVNAKNPGAQNRRIELWIQLFDGISEADVMRAVQQVQGVEKVVVTSSQLFVVARESAIEDLSHVSGVEWIQEAPLFRLMDFVMEQDVASETAAMPVKRDPMTSLTGYESGNRIIGMEKAWERVFFGEGQIVGEGDTGVDVGNISSIHPDLRGVSFGHPIGYGSKSWEDSNGHGTHVAGSVLGTGALSDGKIRGGANAAKLSIVGLWSPMMNGLVFGSDMSKVFDPAYKDGARIHTNSWGRSGSGGAYDAMSSKTDDYVWNHPDLLVLFAAGNDGADLNKDGVIDEGSVSSPATAKNILTIGASENLILVGGKQGVLSSLREGDKKWSVEPLKSDRLSNNPNGMAGFSSRGPCLDGRIKPEVVAPGTNIVSTRSRHKDAGVLWGEFNQDYAYSGGTSMATPIAAGAAAVAREFIVKAKGFENPSAALVKAVMVHTAYDMYPGQFGEGPKQELPTHRPNNHEGYGRIDMDTLTGMDSSTQLFDNKEGIVARQEVFYDVRMGQSGNLRATLVYTDAPASPSAAKALVDDIDLSIVAPNGNRITKSDRKNNTEMLEVQGQGGENYRVSVKAINLPQTKQGKLPYAVVISSN